ncbi:MAG: hypothetical protein M1836_005446 [Candelina mexicana]|nr:MAG: hypothetical protein M1836_005446 [Candelina mexicana]
MDPQNILRASDYINNLLLARGLLRNGTKISFAPTPKSSKSSKTSETSEASIAQIINLVHDLILRHDASASQRETLSSNIRSMRVTESENTARIETLQAEVVSLTRQLAIAQGRERAAYTSVRKAEAAAKSLRDEMARLKTVLGQVRTSCANDIRKRDVQISKLKGQLTTQQRGARQPLSASTITITPGVMVGSQSGSLGAGGSARASNRGAEAVSLESPDYSLRQETTEFLTSLSQSLSDENDSLIALVRESLATLRTMQGLPAHGRKELTNGSYAESISSWEVPLDTLTQAVPSYETLATEMHHVLGHLRTLLTNPSFVPIEEVEAREDEIVRLREGWEKMEGRWREAVGLMDGWRKRMAEGGQVQIEELKMGLGLGVGLHAVFDREENGAERADEKGDGVDEEDHTNVSFESPETQIREGDQPGVSQSPNGTEASEAKQPSNLESREPSPNETEANEEEPSFHPQDTTQDPIEAIEDSGVLRETNPNARPEPSPRKVSFNISPSIEDESIDEVALLNASSPTPAPQRQPTRKIESQKPSSSTQSISKPKRKSISSPITIQQKLKEVQAEAEAVQAAKSAESLTSGLKPVARRGGRRKRKSTLSPEELEILIAGF